MNKHKTQKPLIGVEFTSDNIAVAQVSYVPDQLPRLLLCESSNYNATQNQSQNLTDVSKAFKAIASKINSKKFAINAAIQQQDRQLLLIEAPQVESSEMNEAARWKIKDMIDYSIEDAVVDVIEIPNIKELKRSPMIYAVVVKRDKIKEIAELCSSCGSDLAVIDIPDMAQRNFAALLPEDQNGVAILSINSNNSLLTITRQGELYLSRELETGFEHLLSSIQTQTINSKASDLSSEQGLESNSPGSAAMLKALERMALEVQRSLDYYESQYNQPQINTLFLAPFAYDIPEIKDYFSTQLGVKTKMLDFNVLFSTNEPLSHQLQADTFYAVGGALR